MELAIENSELEILTDFLDEALEHLEGIEEKILKLENSEDMDLVNSIFRPIHTIKGTASFLGLNDIKYLSHEMETLLDDLRNNLIKVSAELIDTLLDGIDSLAQILRAVQTAIKNTDQAADPVKLLIAEIDFTENITAINVLKKISKADDSSSAEKREEEPAAASREPSDLLSSAELKSISYPMEMDISFIDESREHLEGLEQAFLDLEGTPEDFDLVNDIFRALHSLKGSAGVLVSTVDLEEYRRKHPLTIFQSLAHAAEGLMQGARDTQTALSPDTIETLLMVVDRLGAMLNGFINREPVAQADDLIASCLESSDAVSPEGTKTEESATADSQQPKAGEIFALSNTLSQSLNAIEVGIGEIANDEKREAALAKISRSLKMIIKVSTKLAFPKQADTAESILNMVSSLQQAKGEDETTLINAMIEAFQALSDQISVEDSSQFGQPPAAAPPASAPREQKPEPERGQDHAAAVIKVPQERLDILMNLVGELIVSKSSFPDIAREITIDHNLTDLGKRVKGAGEQVGRITDELQNIVMKMRMLPVGTVFSKFKRLVRDLSKKLNKKIVLQLSGEETELDKTIIETLGDPMVHLIRNCADHALEGVDERKSVGKPAEGTIHLKAYNQGQNVIIEIIDDGRGIDPDNIRAKAVEKGYLTLEELEKLDDQAVQNLIFRAGFSGAKEITEVSGRGVGMDVVRTNVEKIGGVVSLRSSTGVGTTITITLPLTLAVSKGLEVRAEGHHYYLPLDYIMETVKISPELVRSHKETLMAVIRGDLLPVFSLSALLGRSHSHQLTENTNREISLVVLNMNGTKAALAVDCFYTENEYVIKPLSGSLAKIPGLSGATITSSGQVILILDPLKLF